MSNDPFDIFGVDDMDFLDESTSQKSQTDRDVRDKIVGDFLDGKYDANLIKEFHESAKKRNLKDLSEIIPVVDGVGFTFEKSGTTSSIFYCPSSLCMLESHNGSKHEITINEM